VKIGMVLAVILAKIQDIFVREILSPVLSMIIVEAVERMKRLVMS
jgi:hypothetical protein